MLSQSLNIKPKFKVKHTKLKPKYKSLCLGWACSMHGLLYCWTLQRSLDNHKYAWAGLVVCMDFSTAGPSKGHKTIINMPGLGL